MTTLEWALKYREKGYSVIPLNPYNKHPFFKFEEYMERQSTEKEIQKWWKEFPTE